MSATGLDVFDKTLQTTNTWLSEIMEEIGPDRQLAWHVLGAVLRSLRDRLPIGLAAHLGAQLPLLVRGVYYDQWRPSDAPLKIRTVDDFLEHVAKDLEGVRPVNVQDAVRVVMHVLDHHINPEQVAKVREALPKPLRELWPEARPGRLVGQRSQIFRSQEAEMKIRDAMHRDVQMVRGDQTISDAAQLMAQHDLGSVPVQDGDRLIGMITDRDIAVRAIAAGKGPTTPISEVMSGEVLYCFEDEDVEHVVQNMGDVQVRRLPVMNRDKRLVGIISLGDLALAHSPESAGVALSGIARPGGQHSQKSDGRGRAM